MRRYHSVVDGAKDALMAWRGQARDATALPIKVFPNDHTAPGNRWLSPITVSNALMIQSQSASVRLSVGKSLTVRLPCPATCVRIWCSLNSGIVINWQNSPLLAASIRFQEARNFSERGA